MIDHKEFNIIMDYRAELIEGLFDFRKFLDEEGDVFRRKAIEVASSGNTELIIAYKSFLEFLVRLEDVNADMIRKVEGGEEIHKLLERKGGDQ